MKLKKYSLDNYIHRYNQHFIISCIVHISLSIFTSLYLSPYSHQSQLTISSSTASFFNIFSFFQNFDGYHFIYNQYTHLPNFAFLPGYRTFVDIIVSFIGVQIGVLVLVFVNLIVMWGAMWELDTICKKIGFNYKMRENCVLLFVYNPACVFFHSIYSQAMYSFITFKFLSIVLEMNLCKQTQSELTNKQRRNTLQQLEKDKNQNLTNLYISLLKCIILLVLAMLIRSTTLFLLPAIGFPILFNLYRSLKNYKFFGSLKWLFSGTIILICVFLTFYSILQWAYQTVCHNIRQISLCQVNRQFINIYPYVQDKYWNVGIFTYYRLSNLVFILFGLPSVIFSIFTLMYVPFKKMKIQQISLEITFIILLTVTVVMTNLQSSTRFLCSHPIFYINYAFMMGNAQDYLINDKENKEKERLHKVNKVGVKRIILYKLFKMWQLGYFYVGIVMFTLNFPWT